VKFVKRENVPKSVNIRKFITVFGAIFPSSLNLLFIFQYVTFLVRVGTNLAAIKTVHVRRELFHLLDASIKKNI
jgi:hypothetical protein